MHIQTVRSIAKSHNIKSGRMTKAEMIRAVQRSEGNFDCFGSATEGECDQRECLWRDDCLTGKKSAKKGRSNKKPA